MEKRYERRMRFSCSLTLELRGTAAVGRQALKSGTVYIFCLQGLVARRCCSRLSDWLGCTFFASNDFADANAGGTSQTKCDASPVKRTQRHET
jgi:hypothetical protein